MPLKIYNTLTRKKETFKPVNDELVRMYTCGPTVYNYAHIGNFRTYLFEDLLRRWLKYKGYKVKQVMNLTDVDDKTIRDSQKEGKTLKEFTEFYSQAFFEDVDALNIERAEEYPKATEHINEMITMIKLLLQKELAYKTEDGIYFSINKFKTYGELAHVDTTQLKAGASGRIRADEYEKDNVADFVLWKFWDENDGAVFWEMELGKGRPGWHIECSAMSAKHLTKAFQNSTFYPDKFETIDVHTGGVDNLFPHHQDEVAQTEGIVNKQFSKYWMHSEHLLVDGKKMAKSTGNFYTLRDLATKGHNPIAIRYLLLSAHYRQKLNFTFESLEAAATAVQRINDFVLRLEEATGNKDHKEITRIINRAQKEFEKALDDDLEISRALAAVFELMNEINKFLQDTSLSQKDAKQVIAFMKTADSILGILTQQEQLTPEIQKLIDERERARQIKNWSRADEIRDELAQKGIAVEDTPHGQRWKKILS
ncbi:cysteine--tRNA ligase [Candidatus Woesearchaeota archaeon CG10_big_fil_rev_8_21_14_0_10_37_12]|nr:MAG: cysteine--tRNA ligase [Candidatus Woesearchaeota archaeon CG10_big_fil_rev_8_21_14_0_10_37_12]